jgi:hypothetical protein
MTDDIREIGEARIREKRVVGTPILLFLSHAVLKALIKMTYTITLYPEL